jgi:rod shape determining protein RodA
MISQSDFLGRVKRMDFGMLVCVLALCVIGIFFIYSAGYQHMDRPVHLLYKRQILWVFLGMGLYVFVATLDYEVLTNKAHWFYLGALVLGIVVLLWGREVNGAKRWLNVGIKVQPAEFMKAGLMIYLAAFLSQPGRSLDDLPYVLASLILCGLPFVLIALQPDLGTAFVLLPMTLGVMYVAKMPYRFLILIAVVGLLLLPVGWLGMKDYQKERLTSFLHPEDAPTTLNWNRNQSEIAVGSGGLTGKGFLKGTQNILGFLPSTVAPTDFIYSVIAEETGFMGTAVILSLYCYLFFAIARAALRARDRVGRYLAVGALVLLFTHVLVNIAMTVGLMPITGLPLPLLSYGGSFTLSTLLVLGLVQSIYIRRIRQ